MIQGEFKLISNLRGFRRWDNTDMWLLLDTYVVTIKYVCGY